MTDKQMLSWLDELEDFPNFYNRKKVSVVLDGETKDILDCWMYVLADFKLDLLKEKCLQSYSASDPNVKPYTPRFELLYFPTLQSGPMGLE